MSPSVVLAMAMTPLKIFTAHGQHMFTRKGRSHMETKIG